MVQQGGEHHSIHAPIRRIDSRTQHLATAYAAVSSSLDHPDLPVRIQAALALTEMITSHETGQWILVFSRSTHLRCLNYSP
jgi:hypothetical protein